MSNYRWVSPKHTESHYQAVRLTQEAEDLFTSDDRGAKRDAVEPLELADDCLARLSEALMKEKGEWRMIESHNDEALICKAAASLLGEEALLRMAIEECSELTAKISKVLRREYRKELISKADLAEDVADVQIMMDQLCEVVGPESVSKWKEYKLHRLKTRLKTRNVFVDYEPPNFSVDRAPSNSFSISVYHLYSLHKDGGNKKRIKKASGDTGRKELEEKAVELAKSTGSSAYTMFGANGEYLQEPRELFRGSK